MKNLFTTFILIFLFLVFFKTSVLAQSSYVLPYPSNMPGNFTYKLHVVFENVSKYWYFGDFGQFSYGLKMSDKYLVEAKTLFEYRQYLLGHKALLKSDFYFSNILPSLIKAEGNKKNISQKKTVLFEAALKHIETLEKMEAETPDTFNWEPEKSLPTVLHLKEDITKSILRRKNIL